MEQLPPVSVWQATVSAARSPAAFQATYAQIYSDLADAVGEYAKQEEDNESKKAGLANALKALQKTTRDALSNLQGQQPALAADLRKALVSVSGLPQQKTDETLVSWVDRLVESGHAVAGESTAAALKKRLTSAAAKRGWKEFQTVFWGTLVLVQTYQWAALACAVLLRLHNEKPFLEETLPRVGAKAKERQLFARFFSSDLGRRMAGAVLRVASHEQPAYRVLEWMFFGRKATDAEAGEAFRSYAYKQLENASEGRPLDDDPLFIATTEDLTRALGSQWTSAIISCEVDDEEESDDADVATRMHAATVGDAYEYLV
jgi:hypothetical protein